jgi:cytochrome c oxidase subunit 4
MTPAQRRHVLWQPIALWVALMLLLGATVAYAYLPHAPAKTAAGLAIAAAKALLIALFFMQLRKATWLVRLAALTGVTWVSFLYVITFADYLTR